MLHLSSTFLNRWDRFIVTLLMSFYHHLERTLSINWFFFLLIIMGDIFWLLCMPSKFWLKAKCYTFYLVGCWLYFDSYRYSWPGDTWLAQSVEHTSLHLGAVSSSPTWGIYMYCSSWPFSGTQVKLPGNSVIFLKLSLKFCYSGSELLFF